MPHKTLLLFLLLQLAPGHSALLQPPKACEPGSTTHHGSCSAPSLSPQPPPFQWSELRIRDVPVASAFEAAGSAISTFFVGDSQPTNIPSDEPTTRRRAEPQVTDDPTTSRRNDDQSTKQPDRKQTKDEKESTRTKKPKETADDSTDGSAPATTVTERTKSVSSQPSQSTSSTTTISPSSSSSSSSSTQTESVSPTTTIKMTTTMVSTSTTRVSSISSTPAAATTSGTPQLVESSKEPGMSRGVVGAISASAVVAVISVIGIIIFWSIRRRRNVRLRAIEEADLIMAGAKPGHGGVGRSSYERFSYERDPSFDGHSPDLGSRGASLGIRLQKRIPKPVPAAPDFDVDRSAQPPPEHEGLALSEPPLAHLRASSPPASFPMHPPQPVRYQAYKPFSSSYREPGALDDGPSQSQPPSAAPTAPSADVPATSLSPPPRHERGPSPASGPHPPSLSPGPSIPRATSR
ncbi:MAG: hypothetical protein M1817_001724 [Caeruleum heppii]|nr:MAG: hypothetical protein M1817_001724 [Caeruleum heppii]